MCALCTIPSPLALGQSAQEILKASIPLEDLPRYKANFEVVLPSIGVGARTYGVLYGDSRPGRGRRQRRDTVCESAGGTVTVKFTAIIEGGKMYQFFPGQKQVVEMPGQTTMEQMPLGARLSDPANYRLKVRRDTLGGRRFFVLVVTFLEPVLRMERQLSTLMHLKGAAPVITRQERWIDPNSFVICRVSSYDADGHVVSEFRYSNIQTNVSFRSGLFAVPGGHTIVRATNTTQIVRELVKQTIASVSGGPRSARPRSPSEARTILLVLILVQAGAAAVLVGVVRLWRARRRRDNVAPRSP